MVARERCQQHANVNWEKATQANTPRSNSNPDIFLFCFLSMGDTRDSAVMLEPRRPLCTSSLYAAMHLDCIRDS